MRDLDFMRHVAAFWLAIAAAAAAPSKPTPQMKQSEATRLRPAPMLYPQMPVQNKMDSLRAVRILVREMSMDVPKSYQRTYKASARVMHGGSGGRHVHSGMQAQALLITSIAASTSVAQGNNEAGLELLGYAIGFFLGWQRMCISSKWQLSQTCVRSEGHADARRHFGCGPRRSHTCLPDRMWTPTLDKVEAVGSSSDADADAILALILLVVHFEGHTWASAWWDELGQWAYDSCKAFMHFSTEQNADGDERVDVHKPSAPQPGALSNLCRVHEGLCPGLQ
jgi:hypothetical protein